MLPSVILWISQHRCVGRGGNLSEVRGYSADITVGNCSRWAATHTCRAAGRDSAHEILLGRMARDNLGSHAHILAGAARGVALPCVQAPICGGRSRLLGAPHVALPRPRVLAHDSAGRSWVRETTGAGRNGVPHAQAGTTVLADARIRAHGCDRPG